MDQQLCVGSFFPSVPKYVGSKVVYPLINGTVFWTPFHVLKYYFDFVAIFAWYWHSWVHLRDVLDTYIFYDIVILHDYDYNIVVLHSVIYDHVISHSLLLWYCYLTYFMTMILLSYIFYDYDIVILHILWLWYCYLTYSMTMILLSYIAYDYDMVLLYSIWLLYCYLT